MAKGIKTGGRKAGSPNFITKDIRETLKNIIEQEFNDINNTLSKLEPEKRLDVIIKLLPYVVPKLESVGIEFSGDINTNDISKYSTDELILRAKTIKDIKDINSGRLTPTQAKEIDRALESEC